jgi:hypothetical protein
MTGFNTGKAYSRSGKFASQAVEHVRTVASLGRLNAFVDEYFRTLEYPIKVRLGRHAHGSARAYFCFGPFANGSRFTCFLTQVTRRSAHVSGLTFGITEFFMFGIWSLSFYYGAILVQDGECSFGYVARNQHKTR